MIYSISARSDREYPAGVWWCTDCQGYFDDEVPKGIDQKDFEWWLRTYHPITAHMPEHFRLFLERVEWNNQ